MITLTPNRPRLHPGSLAFTLAALFLLLLTPLASAHLGGFEQADGYVFASTSYYNPPTFDDWVDVTDYNAGQWGANSGGGPIPVEIPVNSGLWKVVSGNGDFFPTAAARNVWLGAGPLYPAPTPIVQATMTASYVIGNHFGGRLGTTALALRNYPDSLGNTFGPMKYDYTLDSFDFGGPAPATVTSGTVTQSFYFNPNPGDNIVNPVGTPADKFMMSFTDSTGSVGFQWGYLRDNSIVWRQGNAGTWNTTGLFGDPTNYDGVTASIDLSTQTFKIDYFDISTSLTTTIAPAGTPLGNSMVDFTHLGWWLTDNLTSGIGGKNFFDDFSFSAPSRVPEPASLTLLALGTTVLLRRRRNA